MRVRALQPFSGMGLSVSEGDEFELPDGADWLRAGLVEPVESEVETATEKRPTRRAVKK
jgi:hypothetical protein